MLLFGRFGGSVDWSSAFFNDKMQLFGIPSGAEYLDPSSRTDLFQFAPGLTAADFGQVEMAVDLGVSPPGGTLFGSVQFGEIVVPEPCLLAFGSMALICVTLLRRR